MKRILVAMSFTFTLASALPVLAQEKSENHPPGPPPGVSKEQMDCMKKILGEPGKGEHPTHEKIKAAAETCHLPPPPAHHKGPPSSSKEDSGEPQDKD